jgi:hypothetical protein
MKKGNFLKHLASILTIGIFMFMAVSSGSDSSSEKNEEADAKPKERIGCTVCGKDLTNDLNKIQSIATSGVWYCTPCHRSTMDNITDELEAEGY